MTKETYVIKSLLVQNTIMLVFLAVPVVLLLVFLWKKRSKHAAASAVWVLLVLWFFNSPFFGFSAVTLGPEGIGLHYGVVSFRNDLMSLESPWKVESYLSGIRKNKMLHHLAIGDHQSMRVEGTEGLRLLEEIGEAIETRRTGH